MANLLTLRAAAQALGYPPRLLSDLFYEGKLPDSLCVFVGSRRAIPEPNLSQIRTAVESQHARRKAAKNANA